MKLTLSLLSVLGLALPLGGLSVRAEAEAAIVNVEVGIAVANRQDFVARDARRLEIEALESAITTALRQRIYSTPNLTHELAGSIRARFEGYVRLNQLRLELDERKRIVRRAERDREPARIDAEMKAAPLQVATTEADERRIRAEFQVIKDFYQAEAAVARMAAQ